MNDERLYSYRFRGVDQARRESVWVPIARFVYERLGRPRSVLDPAAGRCEFINSIPAPERWAVDRRAYEQAELSEGTHFIAGAIMDVELPRGHFDAVFVSNFLEHLPSPDAAHEFLRKMRECSAPRGRIAVLGPNIRYCADEYWDCADHELALTHVAVEEHLYAAGYEPIRTAPRFLPYSFRGVLPPSRRLTELYLRCPPAWRLLGKQYLVEGQRA